MIEGTFTVGTYTMTNGYKFEVFRRTKDSAFWIGRNNEMDFQHKTKIRYDKNKQDCYLLGPMKERLYWSDIESADTDCIQTKTWKYRGKRFEVGVKANHTGFYTAYTGNCRDGWEEYGMLERDDKLIKGKPVWDFKFVGFYIDDKEE